MLDDEVAYYRAVEDHFARLRGTPFLFTPKDFGLLRRWWQEGVPLAAVMAGVGEAMARRAERGEDPVSSLAYCRHAVARHARRLLAAAVGGAAAGGAVDAGARLATYAEAVRRAAARQPAGEAAAALAALADAVLTLPADAPPAALDATAASLERAALAAAMRALPPGPREALAAEIRSRELAAAEGGELPATARQAILLQAAREALALPRLDLVGDAPQD
jgi:hypothetical protein